jgi:hypothetical protein
LLKLSFITPYRISALASPNMVRELRGLCIPKEEYKRIDDLLERLKGMDDRVPKNASVIDYIARVIIPNGITLTERETVRRDAEANPRLVVTPDEVRAQGSGEYRGTRSPINPRGRR